MPVSFDSLVAAAPAESSHAIRERVVKARRIQAHRYAQERHIHCNAQMNNRLLGIHAGLDREGMELLRETMTRLDMSARAYDRILKVARTIADLDYATREDFDPSDAASLTAAANAPILSGHLYEALAYRNLDRSSWGKNY